MVVVETRRPFWSVARSAFVRPVSQVLPVFVNCVVDARVLFKRPTTVEDACDTYPLVKVPRPVKVEAPVTASVEESVVAPVTPSVPVAITLQPKNAPPWTSSLLVGELVPIPTLPPK